MFPAKLELQHFKINYKYLLIEVNTQDVSNCQQLSFARQALIRARVLQIALLKSLIFILCPLHDSSKEVSSTEQDLASWAPWIPL